MDYCIEIEELSQRFSVLRSYRDLIVRPFQKKEITALSEVNLGVRKGEFFALLGPNGAGKTTLIKILATLILPSSGRALVHGLDVTRYGREVRRRIGYVVGDERSFYWRLTGRQNLRFFATLNNLSGGAAAVRIQQLLEFVGLEPDADRMFKDYSSGMRQKLAIARGLLTDPEIIFMDEPTKSLDPLTADAIRSFVREKMIGERKRTVLYATHNLREAEAMCDRLAIISRGSVKYVGAVNELKKKYAGDLRYLIRMRTADQDLIKRLESLRLSEKIAISVYGPSSDTVLLEVAADTEGRKISDIVAKIIAMGGQIISLLEKELTIEEVFSKVVQE